MKTVLSGLFLILAFLAASIDFAYQPEQPPQPAPTVVVHPAMAPAIEAQPKMISRETEPETWTVTAYCACAKCCGKTDGITASGEPVEAGVTVAADPAIPFGTRILVEGIGERVVMDRGSAIRGKHIDLYIADHKTALEFGVRELEVRILE